MANIVQWLSQSDYSTCMSTLEEFYYHKMWKKHGTCLLFLEMCMWDVNYRFLEAQYENSRKNKFSNPWKDTVEFSLWPRLIKGNYWVTKPAAVLKSPDFHRKFWISLSMFKISWPLNRLPEFTPDDWVHWIHIEWWTLSLINCSFSETWQNCYGKPYHH